MKLNFIRALKCKFVPVHARKFHAALDVYVGTRLINFSTRWVVSGLFNTSVNLTPEKYFQIPTEGEDVWATWQVQMG